MRDFKVGGVVTEAILSTAGDVRLVRAKEFNHGGLIVDGQLNSLRAERFLDGVIQGRTFLSMIMTGNKRQGISGDLDAEFSVNRVDLMRLQRGGNMSGTYRYTATLDMFVDGNMENARIIYTVDLGAAQAVTRLWDVRGGMINSQIFTLSSMGTMRVGWMEDSNVYAGATEAANVLPDRSELPVDGNGSAVYQVNRTMQAFEVRGRSGGEASFINSVIFAGTVGNVTIVRPEVENFGTPFGLAVGTVTGSITTRFEDGRVRVRSSDPTPLAVGDYQVRIDFREPSNA